MFKHQFQSDMLTRFVVFLLAPFCLLGMVAHSLPIPIIAYILAVFHWLIICPPMRFRRYYLALGQATSVLFLVLLGIHKFQYAPLPQLLPLLTFSCSLTALSQDFSEKRRLG